jgi:hypothetical protein
MSWTPHTKTDRDWAVPAETYESIEIGSVNITHLLKSATPSGAAFHQASHLRMPNAKGGGSPKVGAYFRGVRSAKSEGDTLTRQQLLITGALPPTISLCDSWFVRGAVLVSEFGFDGNEFAAKCCARPSSILPWKHPRALTHGEFELERNFFASLVSGEPRRPVISSIFML